MPDMDEFDLDGFSIGGSVGPGLGNEERDVVNVGNALEKTGGFTPYATAPDLSGAPRDGLFTGAIMGYQAKTGHDPDGVILKDGPTGRSLASTMKKRKETGSIIGRGANTAPKGGLLATDPPPVAQPPAPRKPVGLGQKNDRKDVRAVRSNLSRIGFGQRAADVWAPDRFDSNLAAGMKRFQRAKGLKVDGVANPNGPTDRALRQQVSKQQAAVKKAYEIEAAKWTEALGAVGSALAGWRIGQQVAQQQNERRASAGLPTTPPMTTQEDGTILNAHRPVVDGDAAAPVQKPATVAQTATTGTAAPSAVTHPKTPNPPTRPPESEKRVTGEPDSGNPDAGKLEPTQAKGPSETESAQQKKDAAKPSSDRYTVRHDVNTKWTAKGTIWTPVDGDKADGGKADSSKTPAPKSPAKREIYVGKFLHDKATERLGLSDSNVDMGAVTATVLGMARAGKSREEARNWLEKNVVSKVDPSKQRKARRILRDAVIGVWATNDKDREKDWYAITAKFTPTSARNWLLSAYTQLTSVKNYMRSQLGRSLTHDAIEHWLNGSGKAWRFDPKYIRSREMVKVAEDRVKGHFKRWLSGSIEPEQRSEIIKSRVSNMPVGSSFSVQSHWRGDIRPSTIGMLHRWMKGGYHERLDFIGATGASKVEGRSAKFIFRKVNGDSRNGTVTVAGLVNFKWWEKFNFDKGKTTYIPSISKRHGYRQGTGKASRQSHLQYVILQDRMRELLKYSNARDYMMAANWQYTLSATLQIKDGVIYKASVRWLPIQRRTKGNLRSE